MVHLTGSVGTGLHRWLKLPERMVRPLTFAGMSVGFATLFGAPIGSAVFALEIPHKRGMEYYESLIPAMIGSLVGYGVFALLTHHGLGPVWAFPGYQLIHWLDLIRATAVGLAAGLVAIAFIGLIRAAKRGFAALHLPMVLKCALGGLILGLLAWRVPQSRFFGESVVDEIAHGSSLTVGVLLALALTKMIAVSVTLGSGWRGGIIIPCFLVGACLGRAFSLLVPGLDPTLAMVCAMAAVNIAVMKVPLGTVLVLVTMTGINAIAPIALAGMAAFLVSGGANVVDTKRGRAEEETSTSPLAAPAHLSPASAK